MVKDVNSYLCYIQKDFFFRRLESAYIPLGIYYIHCMQYIFPLSGEDWLKSTEYSTNVFSLTDILKFDNSYSWTRSKEVFYSIKVLPPNVTPEVHSDLPLMENGEENGQCVNGQEDDEFFECTEDGTNGVSDIKTSTDN